VVPVAEPVEPVALPVDPGEALDALPELEPAGDASVRMNPPPLALLDALPVVAEPDVPVAVELPDFKQPLSVTVCAELDPGVDPDCPAGVCPPDCADAATASAAENTVPNIK
jgi:hypothetical protein